MVYICNHCLKDIGRDALVSYKGLKFHLGCFIKHLAETLKEKK